MVVADLSCCSLGPCDAILLVAELGEGRAPIAESLTSLNLLGNNLGMEGAQAIIALFNKEGCKLKTLCGLSPETEHVDLSRINLSPACKLLLKADLAKGLLTCLSTIKLTPQAPPLAIGGIIRSQIISLDLSAQGLGPTDASLLATALELFTGHLETLNLSGSAFRHICIPPIQFYKCLRYDYVSVIYLTSSSFF